MGILRLHRTIRVAQLIESAGQNEQVLPSGSPPLSPRHPLRDSDNPADSRSGLKYGARRRIRSNRGAGRSVTAGKRQLRRGKRQSGRAKNGREADLAKKCLYLHFCSSEVLNCESDKKGKPYPERSLGVTVEETRVVL